MKKILLLLISLAATPFAFAVYSDNSPYALIMPNVNGTADDLIDNFPPAPSSGHFSIVIDDNVTTPGEAYAENAIPSANFTYDPVTKIIDVIQPLARSTTMGVSRSFNSAFQVSTTRDALVTYSVTVAATISLTTGQSGSVTLQLSPTNSIYTTVGTFSNGNTGTLTIGLNLTNTQSGQIQAYVPKGYYVKLVTSGAATITYQTGQETLL